MADDDTEADEEKYPITARDLSSVASTIRGNIRRSSDGQLAGLTAALEAIERLPMPTGDLIIITASDRYGEGAGRAPGNYDWATLEITWCDMTFSIGEHVYDSGVGGDTVTDTLFFCDTDGKRRGSLTDWLRRFDRLAEFGVQASSEESPEPELDDEAEPEGAAPMSTSPSSTSSWDFNGETVAMGLKLTALYIEDGKQTFREIACCLAADLDMTMKQLKRAGVRGWYEGARATLEDHGTDVSGMDTPEDAKDMLNSLVIIAGWVATGLRSKPDRNGPAAGGVPPEAD